LFFFSSRRRHTRFSRDWSSDVCSSDLTGAGLLDPVTTALWAFSGAVAANWASYNLGRKIGPRVYRSWPLNRDRTMVARARLFFRSEERREGKRVDHGRSSRSRQHTRHG